VLEDRDKRLRVFDFTVLVRKPVLEDRDKRLRVFDFTLLVRKPVLEDRDKQEVGGNRVMRNLKMLCLHRIFIRCSNQRRCDGQGMQHAWKG
jgi:hypothetical protein